MTVGCDVRPGKPEPGAATHLVATFDLGEERIVATGDLCAAFDEVPRDDAAGELIEVGALPAVMPCRRTAHDRGVRDATGDDDVGTAGQGVDDAETAQIGVRRQIRREVAEVVGAGERMHGTGAGQFDDARQQIVAVDVGDRRVQPELVGHVLDRLGAAVRVETARVRHHLDTPFEARAHHVFHLTDERSGVPGTGPLGTDAAENQHRELGQPIAGEHVDGATLDHLERSARTIAEEPRAIRHADRLGHCHPCPFRAGRFPDS